MAAVEGFKLTIEEYGGFKKQGLKDKAIAEKLGINKQQLANWKYLRKDQLTEAGLVSSTKQASVSLIKPGKVEKLPAAPVTEKQNEYAELINELSDALEEAKKKEKHSDAIILELEEKLNGYEELKEEYQQLVKRAGQHEGSYKVEIGKLHAACEDVEEELEKIRSERDELQALSYKNENIIASQSFTIENKNVLLNKLNEENSALRKLVQLWI